MRQPFFSIGLLLCLQSVFFILVFLFVCFFLGIFDLRLRTICYPNGFSDVVHDLPIQFESKCVKDIFLLAVSVVAFPAFQCQFLEWTATDYASWTRRFVCQKK